MKLQELCKKYEELTPAQARTERAEINGRISANSILFKNHLIDYETYYCNLNILGQQRDILDFYH